jgi:S-methylmethionine-dependent homocysteine/selenocysteine methylase
MRLSTPTRWQICRGSASVPTPDGFAAFDLLKHDTGYKALQKYFRTYATLAQNYHQPQIETFRDADADLVTAITMNYVEEAIGITLAAQSVGMPVVIAFTVETDGNLPTGQTLKEAIQQVDAATNQAPAYYGINCAHPNHFAEVLTTGEMWVNRIRGIRANSSTRSHAELNEAPDLDEGNPVELGNQYRELRNQLPHLNVLGGCCDTDDRHIESICKACLPIVWTHFSSRELLKIQTF